MEVDNKNQGKGASKQPADQDAVKAEREARRQAKLAKKHKNQDKNRNLPAESPPEVKENKKPMEAAAQSPKKSVNNPKHISENNKAGGSKQKNAVKPVANNAEAVSTKLEQLTLSKVADEQAMEKVDESTKKTLTKAERRAIQEAQRAAKAAKTATAAGSGPAAGQPQSNNQTPVNVKSPAAQKVPAKKEGPRKTPPKAVLRHRVKLFNHLYADETATPTNFVNSPSLPPAIVRLGVQYATGVVKGCNARCIAFLNTLKSVSLHVYDDLKLHFIQFIFFNQVIQNYETPAEKEFGRSFETSLKTYVDYLQSCRPIAVSVHNAVKYIRWQITQLPKNASDKEV